MKIKAILAIHLVMLAFLYTGCTKAGPTGPAGTPGATGATGNTGANGATDIQAYIGATTNASWIKANNNTEWDVTFPVLYNSSNNTGIGTSVMNAGTVQVFMGDTSKWSAIPLSHDTIQYNYTYQLNSVTIQVSSLNGTLPNNPGVVGFKIIVIPADRINPNVNVHNYLEIENAYVIHTAHIRK